MAATVEDLRRRVADAQRSLALLSVLRPNEDPATGLSMRQATPDAARYRTVLDQTLEKWGSKAAFGQALTASATPSARHEPAPTLDSLKTRITAAKGLPQIPTRKSGRAASGQNFPGAQLTPEYFRPLARGEEQEFQQFYADYARQPGLDPNPDDSRIDTIMGGERQTGADAGGRPSGAPTLESLRARLSAAKVAAIPPIQGLREPPAPRAFGSVERGMGRLEQGIGVLGMETGLMDPETAARGIGQGQLRIEDAPPSKAVTEGLREITEAKGFGEALLAIVRNPSATASVIGESLPMSLPALGLGVLGSLGGPVGTGAGVGTGSAAVEYSASLLTSMQAKGIDPLDNDAVIQALQDPAFMAEARDRAVKRGVAIGVFDALTGGLAGRFLAPAKGPLSTMLRGGAEAGVQAVGGAGGEATAQLATEGRVTSPGEVALEGLPR